MTRLARPLVRLALRGAMGAGYLGVCVFGAGAALSGSVWGLARTALLAMDPDDERCPR